MDLLYKIFSDSNSKAVKINGKLIYKQISSCCEDASITKVPILKQNAGVTLVILKAVKAIKCNKIEFQQLANHAGGLIVGIWRSYKKSKVPEQWLSPPLQDILRGLLKNLNSLRVFVEEQVSTNMFLRFMCNSIDMRQINKYHQRLTITLDKFEIQSHITTSGILIQLLENQKQMSNQIKQRTRVQNSKAKANKAGSSKRRSIRLSTRAGSAKIPVKKKVTRKAGRHPPNPNSKFDWLSEAEEPWGEDEVLPSIIPWTETGNPMNFVLPSSSIYNSLWSTDASYTTGNWALPSYPVLGQDRIFNQRVGNISPRNKRSAHYYRH